MNATIAILVEYVGEQRGARPPLAFVSDLRSVADLDAHRSELAAKHLPPRVHVCAREELEALRKLCEDVIATPMLAEAHAVLAVTLAERNEQQRLNVRHFEVDRSPAGLFLEAVADAVAAAEAKQSVHALRAAL